MIRNFIILGAPGVGKGTLAKKLAAEKGIIHISTGDVFRNEIKNKTELGLKVKSIIDAGQYVPDDITNEIVRGVISTDEVKANGFILDGYPRTENQAEFLESINASISAAILLNASDELVSQRLLSRAQKENRADDTPEVIKKRVEVYNNKTAPLIDWYKNANLLIEINAEGTIEENYQNLVDGVFND